MTTFYGVNPSFSSPNRVKNPSSLGTLTKSHVILTPQGLQRVHDFLLQDQAANLLPKERVRKCRRNRIDKNKPVSVMFNENRGKAHYGNLQICGSIWSCPCLLYTSPSPRDRTRSRMPSSA